MGMRRGNSKEAKKAISSRLRNQGTKNVASVDLYGAVENKNSNGNGRGRPGSGRNGRNGQSRGNPSRTSEGKLKNFKSLRNFS